MKILLVVLGIILVLFFVYKVIFNKQKTNGQDKNQSPNSTDNSDSQVNDNAGIVDSETWQMKNNFDNIS